MVDRYYLTGRTIRLHTGRPTAYCQNPNLCCLVSSSHDFSAPVCTPVLAYTNNNMKLLTHNLLSSKCLKGVKVGYPLRIVVSSSFSVSRRLRRSFHVRWLINILYSGQGCKDIRIGIQPGVCHENDTETWLESACQRRWASMVLVLYEYARHGVQTFVLYHICTLHVAIDLFLGGSRQWFTRRVGCRLWKQWRVTQKNTPRTLGSKFEFI